MIFNMGGGGVVPKYNKDAETITPGTSDQVIPLGTYLRGDLTIAGDANLIPEKLPRDLNLFNVQGTRQPEYGLYVWKKLTAQGGDFVDFVVSDSESAYPDGGTQDGYWYEKVSERITPEMFGCTKMAIDKVVFSSINSISTFNHSLGTQPTIGIVLTDPSKTIRGNGLITGGFYGDLGCGCTVKSYGAKNATISLTPTSFTIDGGRDVYTVSGVEYTVITMA